MKFNHVVCGGTFDHLHIGHKKLLDACIQGGTKVTVGVTVGAMTRHKRYDWSIERYQKRVQNVINYNSSINIYSLTDIFGPTLSDSTIDALFVTNDTIHGAKTINDKRVQLGMKPLSIVVVPFVNDENGEKISSERIRSGYISRDGICHQTLLLSKKRHILPNFLRQELRDPLGRIFPSLNATTSKNPTNRYSLHTSLISSRLISVGDVITYNLSKLNIYPFLSIIDGKSCRKALSKSIINAISNKERTKAPNEKGTIQIESVTRLIEVLDLGHKGATNQLFIEGEEDLLTLAAVLLAPLGFHVWYGQQGVGAIDIHVTEKKKERVYNLIRRFSD